MAKYYEMTDKDFIFTVATDSVEMYRSRLEEERKRLGAYSPVAAGIDFAAHLQSIKTDHMIELDYYGKKRIHNLKYFTWVEQQGKIVDELNDQWYNDGYWTSEWAKIDEWDERINNFNRQTGLLKEYDFL